jgi:hypothetical protein
VVLYSTGHWVLASLLVGGVIMSMFDS